ncbi:MAG TPA: DUF4157 domain-containing protein [Candidatus Thiothrix moscowensis]|uniref:eCIS core domain-containing protein n=1 Tax=Thiothrix sp. UBA2016 TaxID=1947695 RepID=UPI0025F5566D|nr:DUF4157 domain-containing protein [Thiothrix sp. UBA2016]HRJ53114.1 DUF4157 domain-containing protein [Candidatus Thiothrix moscowensis]HRJ93105.1 DUF4157 domain-containing protein [Candidatus Thiothrix moscowensis]
MSRQAVQQQNQQGKTSATLLGNNGVLQRQCPSCGNHSMAGGECSECSKKKKWKGLQTKLTIGEPDDVYEREADRVADQVMRMPELDLRRQPDDKMMQSQPLVQRTSITSLDGTVDPPTSVHELLRSPGQPLGRAERQYFEPRFGHDFSHVRVHTDSLAGESARAVYARAYTVGRNIAFAEGQYSPGTAEGKRLLAHELTHVVQQGNSRSIGSIAERSNCGLPLSTDTRASQQVLLRQLDLAQIQQELQILRIQLSAPLNSERTMLEARLIQLEAMLNRRGIGESPSTPENSLLVFPFITRFSMAWNLAKETVKRKVLEFDEAYRSSSITRGFIKLEDLVPSADDVWRVGVDNGLFKNDEKNLIENHARKLADQNYGRRYNAAKYGHIYGDEQYYENSGKRKLDDSEIWHRGREYRLFLPDEKAKVLHISMIGIARAAALNSLSSSIDPKSPAADRLMDEIHDFTKDPAVVLLEPVIERLFGPYGYKYSDSGEQWVVADAINKAYRKSLKPNQIRKTTDATASERWDECQRRRDADKNNLEAAQFDSNCFQSVEEYVTEFFARTILYRQLYANCGGNTLEKITCRKNVDATFFPNYAAWRDYQRRQAYEALRNTDVIRNDGAIATVGRMGGYITARFLGSDEKEALELSEKVAMVSSLGDISLAVKAGQKINAEVRHYSGGGGLAVSRDAPVTWTDRQTGNNGSAPKSTPTTTSGKPPVGSPISTGVPRPPRDETGGLFRPTSIDKGRGARPFYAKDPVRSKALKTRSDPVPKPPLPSRAATRPAATKSTSKSGKPGSHSTSTPISGTPTRPQVSPGARPETAGSGGIVSINRSYNSGTGVSQTVIEGRLQPTLPQRAGLENLLGPPLSNADRAHLVGRIFGDEAAAGTLYAPINFNRGVQLTMEKTLRILEQEARAVGGYVWYRASNQSHEKPDGKALKEVKYEFQIRLNNGTISKTVRVEFSDIVLPGTPVTKNRPGFTIKAPFE